MANYVNRVVVTIDSREESNFKGVKFGAEEHRVQVNLMNSTGTSKRTPRFGFSLDYVVPETGAVDWASVEDATAKIEFENGEGVVYRRAAVKSVGETNIDGEGEVVQTIEFIAEEKVSA